jgi:PAT family beta-lactamase induction signal transducer AmpG
VNEPKEQKVRHPVLWVISNYIAMGIPFSMVIWVSGTMFKDLGHSDSEITVPIAAIGIMWSLKPFWAGFLDLFKTKKFFVLSTEFIIGVLFILMGLALNLEGYFTAIVAIMWVTAFMSATQDICSDGIYISSLNKARQATYIGVQGMAWNLGRVIAVSAVVWLAGYLQNKVGLAPKTAWMYALFGSGALMGLFGLYHMAMLPTGSVPEEKAGQSAKEVVQEFLHSAADFCNKRSLWGMLAFVFFYRSSEGLLLIEAPLFMQGCIEDGALQLALEDKGIIDGTVSTLVSIAGGLLGGWFISRFSLKRTLLILALCVNVPNLCYVYLSQVVGPDNPLSFNAVAFVVSMEKFWYGFGFVGNMLYMMQQIAPGKFKMTHYAFATAFMNLVLVPTQMVSGPLADVMGFKEFFWLVMFAAAPSIVAAWFAPFPQNEAGGEDHYVDDEARLSDEERQSQAAARHATVYALLATAVFLFPDVLFLGWMAKTESGFWLAFFLVMLAITTPLKLWLAAKAIGCGRSAVSLTEKLNRELKVAVPYLSNAKGAVWGGGILVAISLVLGGYAGKTALGTDWSCAFSERAAECLQPAKKPPRECKEKIIQREGSFATRPGSGSE